MDNLEVRHKKSVANIMKPLVSDSATQNIYLMWPNLVGITERFCNFVSPLMPSVNGDPLALHAIQAAILAYRNEKEEQRKCRAYVLGLLRESASSMSGVTVHGVKNNRVVIWEPYLEPMLNWMVKNQVMTIRTSRNEKKQPNAQTAQMALLVHILTAQDMEDMGFGEVKITL